MPVVPEISDESLPMTVKPIFAKARSGEITPQRFLEALEVLKIEPILKLLYTCKAFGLSLHDVKRMEHARGRGLSDEELEELFAALNEFGGGAT